MKGTGAAQMPVKEDGPISLSFKAKLSTEHGIMELSIEFRTDASTLQETQKLLPPLSSLVTSACWVSLSRTTCWSWAVASAAVLWGSPLGCANLFKPHAGMLQHLPFLSQGGCNAINKCSELQHAVAKRLHKLSWLLLAWASF